MTTHKASPITTGAGDTLYKVVSAEGKSLHGGDLQWSLPTKRKKGGWHEVKGALSMCNRGLHLTREPINWCKKDSRVFEAEYRGEIVEESDSDKVCVRKARLLREVPWSEFQVWSEGHHEAKSGCARAYGSATVEAYDSATVEAYDGATVRAFGSATVEAYGSATVISPNYYGSAAVKLENGTEAVWIDRRGAAVVVKVAEKAAA